MTTPATPILELEGIEKRYQGLRPLRLQSLTIAAGERVAVLGVDAAAAEVLVNLVTGRQRRRTRESFACSGATMPPSPTATTGWRPSIASGSSAERAVLLEAATLQQNLAMPFTLQIDPVATGDSAARGGVGGGVRAWRRRGTSCHAQRPEMSAGAAGRAHLARAIALGPKLLVLEHPTADLPEAGGSRLCGGYRAR